jgi:hypothetical protein
MINSENIIITLVLLYSLYALIRIEFYKKRISSLKKENNQYRNTEQ